MTGRTRTAAATAERRRRFVRQLLERFVWIIPEVPDMLLVAVVRVIAEELEFRHGAAEFGQAPADIDRDVKRDFRAIGHLAMIEERNGRHAP